MDERDITDMVANEASKSGKQPERESQFNWDPSRQRYVPKKAPPSPTNPLRQETLFPDESEPQSTDELECVEHNFEWGVIHQGKKVIGSIATCSECNEVLGGEQVNLLLKAALVLGPDDLDWLAGDYIATVGESIEAMALREIAHWRRMAEEANEPSD